MNPTDRLKKILEIYNHYTMRPQLAHLRKECIELAHAVDRYLDGKSNIGDEDGVIEEMADVSLLIKQLVYGMGVEEDYNGYIDYKIARTLDRIRNGE